MSDETPIAVPFTRPSTLGREAEYVQQSLASGQISGDYSFTKRCRELLQNYLGSTAVLLTTSCTHALEMSGLLLNVQPGDEVIVPSFTFVSTANAYAIQGAKIVFADVREDTLNLDETRLESLITDKTRAIVPVHYAGVGCEMDAIGDIAAKHGLPVVEDNAHGLFGSYRGKPLGTFGALATQSFHATKNFSCGEGGALIVNDPALKERAEIIREKGTNRSRFFRGQVDKYTWVDKGSSYLISDLLAAVLLAQLEQHASIQATRQRICQRYAAELAEWAEDRGVRLPIVPAHCDQAWHMFYLIAPSLDWRTEFIDHLKSRGVQATFHYHALHLSDMGRKHFGGQPGDCPVTEDVADRLLRLPLFNDMTDDDQTRVIQAVLEFSP